VGLHRAVRVPALLLQSERTVHSRRFSAGSHTSAASVRFPEPRCPPLERDGGSRSELPTASRGMRSKCETRLNPWPGLRVQ
jgi:hypothetical protein